MRSSFGGRVSKADGNTDAFCNGNLAPTTVVILVVKLWYHYPKKRWICEIFTVTDHAAWEPSLTYKNRVENGQTLQSSNLFIQWVNQYHILEPQTTHLDSAFFLKYRNMRVILSICAFFLLFVVQTNAAVARDEGHPRPSGSHSHEHHSFTGSHHHSGSFSGHHHTRSETGSPSAATPSA